jgi:hypothetical protein
VLASLALLVLLATPDPCVARDAQGRTFVVCFDPGNRLGVAALPGAALEAGAAEGRLSLEIGLRLRRSRASRTLGDLTWATEHRILESSVELSEHAPARIRALAYEGVFQRHLEEGFILVPTRTPLRIPFPFDIAIAPSFGGYERDRSTGIGDRLELARCALLLDAARDPAGISRLAIGPEVSYAISRPSAGGIQHELEPLSGGQLRLRRESGDGLWAAEARASAGWLLVPGGQSGLLARGEAALERVVLAINDEPVSLRLDARGEERRAGEPRRELFAGLGLVAALGW